MTLSLVSTVVDGLLVARRIAAHRPSETAMKASIAAASPVFVRASSAMPSRPRHAAEHRPSVRAASIELTFGECALAAGSCGFGEPSERIESLPSEDQARHVTSRCTSALESRTDRVIATI
ncbi:hypothetical protein [Nocardia brasiliensis]|uniref:hypothetical protein n=1 Tax=Nocardia brasiliensis TaxID=37326 RepID=UPI00366D8542